MDAPEYYAGKQVDPHLLYFYIQGSQTVKACIYKGVDLYYFSGWVWSHRGHSVRPPSDISCIFDSSEDLV